VKIETAVLEQISQWAQSVDNVRTVILTSSRADPLGRPDSLSDYDVQVFVLDLEPITQNDQWIEAFGPIMVRWPIHPQHEFSSDWLTQLILFENGIRIDFQFTSSKFPHLDENDNHYIVLVDKDHLSKSWPTYIIKSPQTIPPSNEAFIERVNAFWWDIIYVAKGLWRGELNYARYMLDGTIRFDKLLPVFKWYIGVQQGWNISVGIYGRFLHQHLEKGIWADYLQTFVGSSPEDNWSALMTTICLFRRLAIVIAEKLGFEYPAQTDRKVSAFIETIKTLPQKTEM